MINFRTVKDNASKEDYQAVAEATGYSLRTVRAIVAGERKDRRGVRASFHLLFEKRKQAIKSLKLVTKKNES